MKHIFILTFIAALPLCAAPLTSAKITQVVNDVTVYKSAGAPSSASVGQNVGGDASVQTGRKSRAVLTFADNTITRLGQNSAFSFSPSTREVELKQGSVLLQVPKNAGGATIRTATVTAAITGTTSMFEYNPGQWVKLLTLEGTQKLYINGSKTPVLVPAGQMIIMKPDGKIIPRPITIDIKKLLQTSPLAGNGLFGPLPQSALDLIARTIEAQNQAKRQGGLLPTNKIISGPGVRGGNAARDARQPFVRQVRSTNPDSPRPIDNIKPSPDTAVRN